MTNKACENSSHRKNETAIEGYFGVEKNNALRMVM